MTLSEIVNKLNNIAGVTGAIAVGGPGAVFWMRLHALFGMVTKYAEVVLAVKYRERNAKGDWVGGPMYYIKNGLGLKWNWLAMVFSLLGALAALGIGNMTQVNTLPVLSTMLLMPLAVIRRHLHRLGPERRHRADQCGVCPRIRSQGRCADRGCGHRPVCTVHHPQLIALRHPVL